MVDDRHVKIARILVEHSTNVQKGERVAINCDPHSAPLAKEIYKLCLQKGAHAAVHCGLPGFSYTYFEHASEEQLDHFPKIRMYEAENTDVWISIHGENNTKEFANVDPKKLTRRRRVTNPISEQIVNNVRWVGFDYPTEALAQEAGMSLEEYEDFVYGACIQDWSAWYKKMEGLQKAMNETDQVRIVGKDTDLTMSIKGRKAVIGGGSHNMPDGEVFTAPIVESVTGHIRFEYPAIYNGNEVENVLIRFENGKVVEATASKNEHFLKEMLDTDEGAKFLGELGIGTNFLIQQFTKNILFDEKIGGTIHIAFGSAYKECGGTNKSALHWDMIKDLREEGQLYFDGTLVQEKGKFLL